MRGVSLTEEGVSALVDAGVLDKRIGPMIEKCKNEVPVVIALSFKSLAPLRIVGVEPAHPGVGLIDEPFLIGSACGFLCTDLGTGDCERSDDCRAEGTVLEMKFW